MSTSNKKFVLGGGISGLIFAFYNPEYKIITHNIGGRLKNELMGSTIFLHDSQVSRKFLRDIGIDYVKPVTHLVKYYYNGEVYKEVSPIVKELMVIKKLTLVDDLEEMQFNKVVNDTTLSYNDCYIPKLEIDLNIVISKLVDNVEIIREEVVRITKEEIVTSSNRYEYDEIVSTFSAPIFWNCYGKKKDFKYLPVTFVYSNTPPLNLNFDCNLIYFVDTDVKYTRVNRCNDGNYLYEFTGDISREEIAKHYKDLNIIKHFVDDSGIVISDLNNIPPEKVRFVGRFAKWDHRQKMNDCIVEALTKYDFVSVWNKQKEFSSNFFDFNVTDIELQQKLSKEYILHITDESHEFLKEINWKMQSYRNKPVNRKKLLEEWVDIGKFWLGLGNVWGIELDEFFREFWRKSEIVDARYEKEKKIHGEK